MLSAVNPAPRWALLAIFLFSWTLMLACSPAAETPPPAEVIDDGTDLADVEDDSDATDEELPSEDTDQPDEQDSKAVETLDTTVKDVIDIVVPVDAVKDVGLEVQPLDIGKCVTATTCVDQLVLTPCQQAACDKGVCKAVPKPDACCSDADCDDIKECTTDKCDNISHLCINTPLVNCCSGKVTFSKAGFEDGTLESLTPLEGPTNLGVHWQASTYRAHGGKTSLYFGNACHTYDNSMSPDNGCKSSKDAMAVSTQLTTADYALPKDKKAELHFWLFLDAEPPYADTLPKGVCKTPCNAISACVNINGTSQCLPEKDVLSLQVLTANQPAKAVFYSTQIGKTTKNAWQHMAIDLSAYSGQTIKLQWLFSTGTGLKNAYEGVYLDDVVVETICATAGTVCDDQTPCPDDNNGCSADVCTQYQNSNGGVCFFDKKPGCCTLNSECDDGIACTIDTCTAGQCNQTPDASKPACCKSEILENNDFEGAAIDLWTALGSNSGVVKWRLHPKGGPETPPSQALQFSDETFGKYDDAALGKEVGPKGTLCTPQLKLKEGTLFNLVQFDLFLETEWTGMLPANYKNPPLVGKNKFDYFAVQVYFENAFHEAWSSDVISGTTEGAWMPIVVSLDTWKGKTVQVCLSFDAGDGEVNDKLGPIVDNFVVKIACSKKPCYLDGECKNLNCGPCQTPQCTATGCACIDLCKAEVCGACEAPVCLDNACACGKIPACCAVDSDCDDKDVCTTDTCAANGKCFYVLSGAEGCPP